MDFLREDLLMKQSVFETEIFSRSLSLKNAGVRISCDRLAFPKIEWLLPSGELLWASDDADSFRRLHFLSLRSSGLFKNPEEGISLLEHLAPVFLLYPQMRFKVQTLSGELPLLDGSAYPWYEAVRSLAGIPQELAFYDVPLRERLEFENGFWEISPSETLEVEYSISHSAFSDSAYCAIYDAEDLVKIFPARTFIFEEDLVKAQVAGLLSGVDAHSGLLLSERNGEACALVGAPFRQKNEPAMHKILDLIGDLSLPLPFLPKLKIRIHNGGHIAHRKLLERLLDYAFGNSSQVE